MQELLRIAICFLEHNTGTKERFIIDASATLPYHQNETITLLLFAAFASLNLKYQTLRLRINK
jgi:hypothetical protein